MRILTFGSSSLVLFYVPSPFFVCTANLSTDQKFAFTCRMRFQCWKVCSAVNHAAKEWRNQNRLRNNIRYKKTTKNTTHDLFVPIRFTNQAPALFFAQPFSSVILFSLWLISEIEKSDIEDWESLIVRFKSTQLSFRSQKVSYHLQHSLVQSD